MIPPVAAGFAAGFYAAGAVAVFGALWATRNPWAGAGEATGADVVMALLWPLFAVYVAGMLIKEATA